jgi:hypothetical protein
VYEALSYSCNPLLKLQKQKGRGKGRKKEHLFRRKKKTKPLPSYYYRKGRKKEVP